MTGLTAGDTPALIAQAYGLGEVIGWTAAARGSAGEIFKLTTPAGVFAAKEFVAQRPAVGDLERQIAFATKCRAAGVSNPETLLTADDAVLFDHPETDRPWLVQLWAEGTPPERTDLPAACWLARQAAIMHRLALPCHPSEQVKPFYTKAITGWAQIADTALQARFPWAAKLHMRVAEFEDLAALVNAVPVRAVVTCHRDLKATNTLLASDGSRSLLDWDTSGPQEPWRELGMLLLHHVRDADALTAVATAYRAAGGPPWPGGVDLFATGLAVWLNFLHGQLHAALDPAMDARYRASAEQSAARLVDGIPSLATLTSAKSSLQQLS